jgi:class 3 adenylate cyclase
VSELGRPEEPERRLPDVRVSDAERDRLVDELRRFCTDGFLTLDELGDRVEAVLEATTRGELELVVADLPARPAEAEEAAPKPRGRVTRFVVSFMGANDRKGRWRPARRVTAVVLMGSCTLDLRQAEVEGDELVVTAVAVMGGIDVVVPEGVEVDLTGLPIMGSKARKVADVPRRPDFPLVRVRAYPVMGGVVVRSRPPREVLDARRQQRREEREERRRSGHPRPQEAPGAPDGTVTILFTDIEGFTATTERLGDDAAHELLRKHHAIVRRCVSTCSGFEVKTQGDGFMLAFPGARPALRCAVAIQRELERHNRDHPHHPLRVRMGLHAGDVVRDGDDYGGRPVILASRIADQAAGGEVLASGLVRDLTESCGEFEFGEERRADLKGLAGRHVMVPVRW